MNHFKKHRWMIPFAISVCLQYWFIVGLVYITHKLKYPATIWTENPVAGYAFITAGLGSIIFFILVSCFVEP